MRKFSLRKSAAQALRDNLRVREFYAPAADDPRRAAYDASIARHRAAIKPPRVVKKRVTSSAATQPLERHVLKAVMSALQCDPRVFRVERNQSGVFREGNRFIRVGTRGKLDLTVYLKSGAYIELEVKRPGGKPEPHQQARIDEIRRNGGRAGWCWSVESALALLP